MYCEKCGAQIEENYAFCKSCGALVGTGQQNSQGMQPPPSIPQTSYPNVPYGYPQPVPYPSVPPKKHKGWLIALVSILVVAVLATAGVLIFNYAQAAVAANQTISVKFSPANGQQATQQELDQAVSILQGRMKGMEIKYKDISADYSQNCVTVQLALLSKNDEETIKSLGAQGKLIFKCDTYNNGGTILTNDDIETATADKDQSGTYIVSVKLNADGTQKFAEATKAIAGSPDEIKINMDDTLIQSGAVMEEITGGVFQISASSDEKAKLLAAQLNSDALPFAMDVVISGNKK
jgi:Preprotein translocase subunit SecD